MRLLELPLPKLSLPGDWRACARKSPTDLAAELGLTTMIWPPLPSSEIGA